MEKIRLNKYLASLGVASRRAIDKMVEDGRIEVNGELAESGVKVNSEDEIKIDSKLIETDKEEKVYYLLNKPKEYLCSSKDDRGRKLAIDLIDDNKRLFNIGRLDYETEGLILITNDGDIFNHLIHPKKEIFKTYIATVSGELNKASLFTLRDGVELEDGKTLPANVNVLKGGKKTTIVEISIREGKNRQIRRMLRALDHRVYELRRVAIGELKVDGIGLGEYRKLTKEELEYIKSL